MSNEFTKHFDKLWSMMLKIFTTSISFREKLVMLNHHSILLDQKRKHKHCLVIKFCSR